MGIEECKWPQSSTHTRSGVLSRHLYRGESYGGEQSQEQNHRQMIVEWLVQQSSAHTCGSPLTGGL